MMILSRAAFAMLWVAILLSATGSFVSRAAAQDSVVEVNADVADSGLLSEDEIRALVAPVALYPDDLLAIVLPAATNPLQVVQAGRYLEKHKADASLQPDAEWDPAVLALINYPDVIQSMNDDLEWTEQLGNEVMDQQSDVLDMIQHIRAEATSTGYLASDEQQKVTQQGDTVVIESAQPEVVYVPTYDPQVVIEHSYSSYPPPVYSEPYPYYYAPGATFFAGAMTGAVFAYGFDWDDDDIDIDCCDGDFERGDFERNVERNFENTGDINIGSNNTRERNVDSSRFNADAKAGQGKMKWNSQKAKRNSTTSKQTRTKKSAQGVAPTRKAGQGSSMPSTNVKQRTTKSNRPGNQSGKVNINKGLGDYQSGSSAKKQSKRGSKSMSVGVGSTSRQSTGNRASGSLGKSSTRPGSSRKSGAFGGSGGGSKYVPTQRSRGSGSMQRSGRPSRSSRR